LTEIFFVIVYVMTHNLRLILYRKTADHCRAIRHGPATASADRHILPRDASADT